MSPPVFMTEEELQSATRALIESGQVISGGFAGFMVLLFHDLEEPTENQIKMMRLSFFAGAQHVFAAMLNTFDDDGKDPTQADANRMRNIDKELQPTSKLIREMAVAFKEKLDAKRKD